MGSNLIPAKVDCILHLQSGRLSFEKLRGKTPGIIIVEPGEHPDLPPLHPHHLVLTPEGAVSIEVGKIAAVLPVERVLQPEGDNVLEKSASVLFV